MDTNIQSRVLDTNQLGAVPSLRGYEFDYTTKTISLCSIDGQLTDPVFVEFFPLIITAFNAGTTNSVVVSTTTPTTVLTIPNPTITGFQGTGMVLFQAQSALILTYSYTGTKPTAGQGLMLIRVSGLGKGLALNLGNL